MRSTWWTVTPDEGFKHEGPVDVLVATAEIAAIEWARGRGHDPDDQPLVEVSAPGEPTRRFELRGRVVWSAKPTVER